MITTHRYAVQILVTLGIIDHARLNRWKATSFETNTIFIALMIWMDLVQTQFTCIHIVKFTLSTNFIRVTNL